MEINLDVLRWTSPLVPDHQIDADRCGLHYLVGFTLSQPLVMIVVELVGPIGELESDSIQKTSARWRASLGAT
jgi:hypothetical protein